MHSRQGGQPVSAFTMQHSLESGNRDEHSTHGSTAPTSDDIGVLRYMRTRLFQHLGHLVHLNPEILPALSLLTEPVGRQHRIILMNGTSLWRGGRFAFVGFFGRKRPDTNVIDLDLLDRELIAEFADYPHLLSYSSLELSDGSWANLVVMSSPEGAIHWAKSARHTYAAHVVAPQCYTTIRLHTGTMSANSTSGEVMTIERTKIFDFG
jgi:hypothetical protein